MRRRRKKIRFSSVRILLGNSGIQETSQEIQESKNQEILKNPTKKFKNSRILPRNPRIQESWQEIPEFPGCQNQTARYKQPGIVKLDKNHSTFQTNVVKQVKRYQNKELILIPIFLGSIYLKIYTKWDKIPSIHSISSFWIRSYFVVFESIGTDQSWFSEDDSNLAITLW